ncbi:MAG: PH domain-containing protein [Muribaculaceae bacterium]|nr:PH domain-containing protein [Muribaculaceae bacterium]
MKKYKGSLYRSRWDASTWGLLLLVVAGCILPFFFDDDGLMPVLVSVWALIAMVVILRGIFYRIDGKELVVYQFYIPKAYPIDKIAEIIPVKSYLSAPATSFTHRIGIRFSDRKILKSTMLLVISPEREEEFIKQLKTVNPDIIVRR